MEFFLPMVMRCGSTNPVWRKFCDLMDDRALARHGTWYLADGTDTVHLEIDAELVKYGAWTDWDDWEDPLWFPDSEQLTAFVLTYG